MALVRVAGEEQMGMGLFGLWQNVMTRGGCKRGHCGDPSSGLRLQVWGGAKPRPPASGEQCRPGPDRIPGQLTVTLGGPRRSGQQADAAPETQADQSLNVPDL